MISAHGFVAPTMDGGVPPNAALTYPAPMASLPAYGVPAAPNTFSNVEYIPHRVFVGGFSSQVCFIVLLKVIFSSFADEGRRFEKLLSTVWVY